MNKIQHQEIADRFAEYSYKQLSDELKKWDTEQLIELIDAPSVKIGDTAVEIVGRRCPNLLIKALLGKRVKTSVGKLRALNVMHYYGKQYEDFHKVFSCFLNDRSFDVVDAALFGLVFWQDQSATDLISKARSSTQHDRASFDKAIEALEKRDPFIFSPHFCDAGDVWELDKSRFADKIGMQ